MSQDIISKDQRKQTKIHRKQNQILELSETYLKIRVFKLLGNLGEN